MYLSNEAGVIFQYTNSLYSFLSSTKKQGIILYYDEPLEALHKNATYFTSIFMKLPQD